MCLNIFFQIHKLGTHEMNIIIIINSKMWKKTPWIQTHVERSMHTTL
jgi:hypothetical protein